MMTGHMDGSAEGGGTGGRPRRRRVDRGRRTDGGILARARRICTPPDGRSHVMVQAPQRFGRMYASRRRSSFQRWPHAEGAEDAEKERRKRCSPRETAVELRVRGNPD